MDIQVSVAKISRFAAGENSDTLEVVERPSGGFSVVLADGQTAGQGARSISMLVVRKVIGLLAEGVRDGSAAQAASDSLFTEHNGQAACTLNIASVDFQTGTLVLTRNNPAPVFVSLRGKVDCLGGNSTPLGNARGIKPAISEIPVESGLTVVLFTDGLTQAGQRHGRSMDVCTLLQAMLEDQEPSAQELADALLQHALALENNRPADDISVVVLNVMPHQGSDVRRMNVHIPFKPVVE